MSENNKYLSANDISLFCGQVALILKAAIPIQEGIAAIHENIQNSKSKELIKSIEMNVLEKGSFYLALKETKVFPPYLVNMVNIGEKSGKLDEVMEALSNHYIREDNLKSQISSAVLYPFILILMMSAVVTVLTVNILPIFNQVFAGLGDTTGAGAVNIGMTIGKYSFVVVLILTLLFLTVYLISVIPSTKELFNRIMQKLPITKGISTKIDVARFASVLSMLLFSGYDTSEAMDLLPTIMNNHGVVKKVEKCKADIDNGKTFSQAITEAKIFSGIYSSMIHVGAKTGSLDSVMKKIADKYNEEVAISISNTIAVIEPTIVAVLSIMIGAILVSVMLPLMGIMSSIG